MTQGGEPGQNRPQPIVLEDFMARYVTVSSISHRPEVPIEDMEGRLERAAALATRAARMGADIVAFPEIYPHLGAPAEQWRELAEIIPGPPTSRMAEVAREQGIYLIWPLVQREGDRLYNSSVLLDRKGQVAGIYHKMFPTIGEIEAGITPGTEAPVFTTDFGRIGMAICFDLNFRPIMEGLGRGGAEIIFFSSMYRGGLQLRCWAHELGVYLVAAITGELGQVVDMSGTVLAEATYEAVCVARINLDRRLLHMDYNWNKMDAMLEKYGSGVTFQYYTREAKYTIASEMEDVTVDDLIREFELEEMEHYFLRAMRTREEALQGR
ncbi:MAG: carbon-nitrogen hydrolase family protein [Corynebacterium humireducens]|uniref:Carbon-nitrogen hydrolase family protein n=1 Tax=Corynebacterium humireducens TaxID=1223514 RepID=A0A7X6PLH9_9CORY|nr:carbon-nitrogen hydrolase family protein [Corynebacterium humireducens]